MVEAVVREEGFTVVVTMRVRGGRGKLGAAGRGEGEGEGVARPGGVT